MYRTWSFHLNVDFDSSKAVYLQIADEIIKAIRQGKLKPGEVLPGSRKLGLQLKVNRNTVIKALDILVVEGWLESIERKGIFVKDVGKTSKTEFSPVKRKDASGKYGKSTIIFDDGIPDSALAPVPELARAYRKIFQRKAKWRMMGYGDPQGDSKFRNTIAQMLNHKRGLGLTIDHLCITRGSQMALFLTADCLLNKGDAVVVENPGYKPAWKTFERVGAKILPVGVQKDGIDLEQLKSLLHSSANIKAVYITPHHQFPTTVSLSLSKRVELVEFSNKYGFTIIEDDYDHEFHFGSRPLLPIGSISNVENYAYIGTFSKIVSPALRIGYVATKTPLIEKIVELRKIVDVQGDNIMEQAILDLIHDGSIQKHLNKATQVYRKKRDYFDQVVRNALGEKMIITTPAGGLAFWLVPRKKTDIFDLAERLRIKGVEILTPDKFSFSEPVMGLRLGYASLSEEQLSEGVLEIARNMEV